MPDSRFDTLANGGAHDGAHGGALGGADGGARRRMGAPAVAVPPPPYSVTIGGGAPRVPPAAAPRGGGAALRELIVERLEEAGRTLLALPRTGYTTALRQSRLEIVRLAGELYPAEPGQHLRPAMPEAGAITRMDEAFGWLALIPADRYVLRRILGARALVDPLTERHLHSWRRLGTLLGADHRAIQRWHGDAIALIAAALAGGCALPCPAGGVAASRKIARGSGGVDALRD